MSKNNITFKANFDVTPNGEQSLGFLNLKPRMNKIKKSFSTATANEPEYELKLYNGTTVEKDTFILNRTTDSKKRSSVCMEAPFCRDLSKLDDKAATKRLVAILKAMKFKEEQNQVFRTKRAERDALVAQKDAELEQLLKKQMDEFRALLKQLELN